MFWFVLPPNKVNDHNTWYEIRFLYFHTSYYDIYAFMHDDANCLNSKMSNIFTIESIVLDCSNTFYLPLSQSGSPNRAGLIIDWKTQKENTTSKEGWNPRSYTSMGTVANRVVWLLLSIAKLYSRYQVFWWSNRLKTESFSSNWPCGSRCA